MSRAVLSGKLRSILREKVIKPFPYRLCLSVNLFQKKAVMRR